MRKKWIFVAAPLGLVIFIAIGGAVVMLLWNWLAPALFGWRPITFWQAVGVLALCRVLFGGLGLRGGGLRSRIRERMAERWEQRMAERWEQMTPEERERCREQFSGRWGRVAPPDSKPSP